MDASSSNTVKVADDELLAYCESPPKLTATVYRPAASLGVTGQDTLPLESVVFEQLSVPLSEKETVSLLMPALTSSVSVAERVTESLKSPLDAPRNVSEVGILTGVVEAHGLVVSGLSAFWRRSWSARFPQLVARVPG